MATKKQRRRRSKERRHEWEYVYVDDEGHEVEVDEPQEGRTRKGAQKTQTKGAGARQAKGRGGRTVEPPSWRRALRRGAIFAPLMLVVVYFLQKKGDKSIPAALVQTAILLAFFVPFSYLMDTMMYRAFRRRLERGGAEPKRR
jgi:hypothetical protein